MKKKPLFVPVILDVMLYGDPRIEQYIADIAPKYDYLDTYNLFGDTIISGNFDTKWGQTGAHLHWTLPDALLHGKQGEDGAILFPEVPNRWFVFRMQEGKGDIAEKIWLVKSDVMSNEKATTAEGMKRTSIPCFSYDENEQIYKPAGDGGAYYSYLGETSLYTETDREEGSYIEKPYIERLTAVGAGDSLFSAFYPLSQTVFGFYDSLEGIDSGTFTYFVCGYYEREASDVFSNWSAPEVKQEFLWNWEGEEKPDSVLCHGAVCHVCWEGKEKRYAKSTNTDMDVIFANSSTEAISCYFNTLMPEKKGLERILHAFLSGVLQEYDNADQPDAIIGMEDSLHKRAFGYAPAGETWEVALPEDEEFLPEFTNEEDKAIRSLQETAEKRNKAARFKEAYAEEAYLCWHAYISALTSPAGLSGEEEKAKLVSAIESYETIEKEEADLSAKLQELLSETERILAKRELKLSCVPETGFVHPNIPVLLMAESDTDRVFRRGEQRDENGCLPCRLQTVKELQIELDNKTIILNKEDLNDCMKEKTVLPEAIDALRTEVILLQEGYRELFASLALQKAGIEKTKETIKMAAELIKTAQETVSNRPFSIAYKSWEMPWNPIMMAWSVKMIPARNTGEEKIFEKFSLGEIDLETEDTEFKGKEILIMGQTLLTPHAPVLMKKSIERVLENVEEEAQKEKLKALAEKLGRRHIVSQQLTGFYEALAGKVWVSSIPFTAYEKDQDAKELAKRLAPAMKSIYPVTKPGADPVKFQPIRNGLLYLDKFRLIDTFGQYKDINLSKLHIHIGENLSCEKERAALLPPRFIGGMRMKYRWTSAREREKRSLDSVSSPVAGFLMRNRLEQNLQIYDREGSFLGWLQMGDTGVKWRSAPGTSLKPEEIQEKEMRLFIQGVLKWEKKKFTTFLQEMDEWFGNRSQAEGIFEPLLCMGNVLALASAHIEMEEEGPEQKYWGARTGAASDYRQAEIPVKIGDKRRIKDGVAVFFTGDGKEIAYDMPHMAGEELRCSLEHPACSLMLLVDPYREVTLRTGFLPVIKERLAPTLYKEQIKNIQPIISLWPVLSKKGSVQIQESYATWEIGGK